MSGLEVIKKKILRNYLNLTTGILSCANRMIYSSYQDQMQIKHLSHLLHVDQLPRSIHQDIESISLPIETPSPKFILTYRVFLEKKFIPCVLSSNTVKLEEINPHVNFREMLPNRPKS